MAVDGAVLPEGAMCKLQKPSLQLVGVCLNTAVALADLVMTQPRAVYEFRL